MLIRYSVIRFIPFSETQEFANVGVVAYAPQTGIIEYKLAHKRNSRISNFFDDLDGKLFAGAIEMFDAELQRIQSYTNGLLGKELVTFMDELTRRREGFLTYSETAAMLTDKPVNLTLEQLFERYVGRAFNTKEHREALLVRELKSHLDRVTKYKFVKDKLDTGFMSFELPLVATDSVELKAIKPLSFYHSDPLKLVDHGTRWISRARLLLNSDVLAPKDFMFVVETPQYKDNKLHSAFMKLSEEMHSLGVTVHNSNDLNKISQFAKFQSEAPDNFHLN